MPDEAAPPETPGAALPTTEVEVVGAVQKALERNLPRAQAERLAPQLVQITAGLWQAPIPPPSILREFDDVVPGAAKRIMDVFDSEVSHRQKMQRWNFGAHGAGLICGMASVLGMLVLAAYALYLHETAVAVAIPAALAAVAGVFVLRQNPQRKAPPQVQANLSRAERRRLEKQQRR